MKFTVFDNHVRDRTRRSAAGIGSAASISFTGEVHDDETGLDAYKFRSYNPQLGRWMSPDPSSLRFANLAVPQTFNLYAYVTNDPLKYIDLDGLLEDDSTDVVLAEDGIDTSGGDPMIFAGGDVGGGGGDSTGTGNATTCSPGVFLCVTVTVATGCEADACITASPDPTDPLIPDPIPTYPPISVTPTSSTTPGSPQPCDQTFSGAGSLNYSQSGNYSGTVQTAQQHIIARHMSGLPGVSQYYGSSFSQIVNLNSATFLLGTQIVQGNSVIIQFTFPNVAAAINLQNYIGTDASGTPTLTNRLVLAGDCKTVVTSYPIAD